MQTKSTPMGKYTLFLVLIVVAVQAHSTSFQDRDIKVLYSDAVSIVRGRIVSVNAECIDKMCQVPRYQILVIDNIKAAIKNEARTNICSSEALKIGSSYILFIEKNLPHTKECSLIVRYDGIFKEVSGDVFRVQSDSAVQFIKNDDNDYMTSGVLFKGFWRTMSQLKGN